jgi:hypothetical protein
MKSRSGLSDAWDRPVAASVATLLRALPADGTWCSASGQDRHLIDALLEAGSTLIQERLGEVDESDVLQWDVRLTIRGRSERAQLETHPTVELRFGLPASCLLALQTPGSS